MVELPYAAYLSCGYNQFVEACFLHWLSAGRQPNGMVIRMQGFDEGVFGGHFHTANAPPVFGIPGLDVLCYSNGRDWARGLRGAPHPNPNPTPNPNPNCNPNSNQVLSPTRAEAG